MELFDIPATDNPIGFMGNEKDQQQLEQTIYANASAISKSYHGCGWQYVGYRKNVVFMAPSTMVDYEVVSSEGIIFLLSSQAFGLLVTMRGLKSLALNFRYRFLEYKYKQLCGVVEQHTEAKSILSCLSNPV